MTESKPDITETIRNEGINLKQRGRDLWACCPFHEDRTPSLKVDVERQRFKCFGCGEGGDVIDFIQKYHNLDFKNALKYLKIDPGKPPQVDPIRQRKRELLANFEQWRRETYRNLCDTYNIIWHGLRRCKNMEEIGELSEVMCEMGPMEDKINILSGKDEEIIYGIYCAGF